MPATEDVTPGEIVRTLRGLQDEIRALRGENVRRDLYEAHRAAAEAEMARIAAQCRAETERLQARLETADRARDQRRWQMLAVSWGAGLSLLGTIITIITR